MKHLVLGSEGQIGSHLVRYLTNQGHTVIEFDILNEPEQDLRIENNPLLEEYLQYCDIVHFLAYDVGGAKYLEKYQQSYDFIVNNCKIMVNTFELLKKYNKPFIFASSQMADIDSSSYGMLKRMGEDITKQLGGLIVRFWNVYGYEKDEEKSHVITDFIKMAKYDKEINMRTDGTESRQFLYADDACECLEILSESYNKIPRDKNLHISSFKWTTINEIANKIDVLTSCSINKGIRKDETQHNAMNEPDPYILNHWTPKTDLYEGIAKLLTVY